MKKLLVALLVLGMIGSATAVVGQDCPEGEMCIQDNGGEEQENDTQENSTENSNEDDSESISLTNIISSFFEGLF